MTLTLVMQSDVEFAEWHLQAESWEQALDCAAYVADSSALPV
jgi:hypothetical protein